MEVRDAAAIVERELKATRLFQSLFASVANGRRIDPAVDLGELPEGVERWAVTGYFRLPSMAGPVIDAVFQGWRVPSFADLAHPAPSWDEVQTLGTRYAQALGAFVAEVAATAPRRPGAVWYHVDLSRGFPAPSLPLLEAARQALTPYVLARVARVLADGEAA